MRASRPSRVSPALLTRMSRSPASSTSARRRGGVGDVGLDRAAADRGGDLCRLVRARAVADRDHGARPRQLDSDRAADARVSRPVTSARLPVERGETASGGERSSRLLEAREVVDGDGADAAVDPLDEPGEDVARPDLDERRDAVVDELARGLREAHGRRQLVDEQRAEALCGLDLGRHGGHERRDRVGEADAVDRRLEPVGRARDERAVECAGDLEANRSSGAEALGLGAALLDCVVLSGDDDLPGAVVVRRPDSDDLPAEGLDVARPRARGSPPSCQGAGAPPRPWRARARARARSPRRCRSHRPPLAPRTLRPSGRRRRRLDSLRRGGRRGWRGSSRRAPAAAPPSRRGRRAATSKQSVCRSSPLASHPTR